MISIIIPTYNEAENIDPIVAYLLDYGGAEGVEVIVVDGGSGDETVAKARERGAMAVVSPQKGRAAQMNFGASLAKGDMLYFVHADTYPPVSFSTDIRQAEAEGFHLGRYRTRFDSHKMILAANAFFTRFDLFACYGGDQTLFITKDLFSEMEGFDAGMRIMEDYEIVVRARKKGRYKIIQKDALVSARKYDTNSWLAVQRANYTIVSMYKKGASQEAMVQRYKEMLRYR